MKRFLVRCWNGDYPVCEYALVEVSTETLFKASARRKAFLSMQSKDSEAAHVEYNDPDGDVTYFKELSLELPDALSELFDDNNWVELPDGLQLNGKKLKTETHRMLVYATDVAWSCYPYGGTELITTESLSFEVLFMEDNG